MAQVVPYWQQTIVSVALIGAAAWVWQDEPMRTHLLDLAGLGEPEAPKGKPRRGVPVILEAVGSAENNLLLEIVGTGRAARSVKLRSEDAGRIVHLALAPGAEFTAGQPVMRLDDEDQRLALTLARTRLEEAERIRDRFSQLQTTGAASTARLDEVLTAAEIARLQLEQAERALAERVLRAPFDGVSGLADVEEGDWVDSDDILGTLDDRSTLLVEIDLPEAALSRISEGMSVEARTPSVPKVVFEGTITAIDSRIDAASRTVKLRVSIPNENDLLRPGASFVLSLALAGDTYPTVPELALQFARGGLHVWRISDGVAEQVEVRMIQRKDGLVLVEGALSPGEQVVVEGTQRLRPGAAVTVARVDTGPAS